jgi:putative oxidoreductase
MQTLRDWSARGLRLAEGLNWLPPLLVRLYVGYFFFETGWSKLHSLDAFAERFAGWGIPYPAFNAALSAYTECLGGAFSIVGLFTRLVTIPMMINMVVAIVSVRLMTVGSLDEFVELDESLYLLCFLWLMIVGAGRVSVDSLLKRACFG